MRLLKNGYQLDKHADSDGEKGQQSPHRVWSPSQADSTPRRHNHQASCARAMQQTMQQAVLWEWACG